MGKWQKIASVLIVATAFAAAGLAGSSTAQSNGQGASQLATSIQPDLNLLGFDDVDAQSLSLRQLGAIRSAFSAIGTGMKVIDVQFRVQAILDSDGYSTFEGVRVDGTRVGNF
ncbi:MAG: hypothetical protein AAGE03_00640 [Pseudomonadota bacterium]